MATEQINTNTRNNIILPEIGASEGQLQK